MLSHTSFLPLDLRLAPLRLRCPSGRLPHARQLRTENQQLFHTFTSAGAITRCSTSTARSTSASVLNLLKEKRMFAPVRPG